MSKRRQFSEKKEIGHLSEITIATLPDPVFAGSFDGFREGARKLIEQAVEAEICADFRTPLPSVTLC